MSKNIKVIYGLVCQEFIDSIMNSTEEIKKMFREDDSIQNTQECAMHWVSVLERLPQVEENVLVYDGFGIYITNRLDEDCIIWDNSTQIFDEITHWMHLPEIPCA